ncbi:hypothetical protein FRB90_006564 [Tulasnella sp. 427]|nr:hypothetical protein FRB90_006564 [Tulasnella sp. 427]
MCLHEDLYSELNRRGVSWDLRQQWSNDIFSGASVRVSSKSDLLSIASVSTVVGIYPVYIRWGPKWKSGGTPTTGNLPVDVMSSHTISGIDKLQAQGYTGKGVKVAVIDSGVDYNLPALGGGFGSGKKVYTGYDFVGDVGNKIAIRIEVAFTGSNTPQPDPDPYDNCYGHGTAVASIIAGNPDSTFNFTGAAPDAKIAAYCSGASSDEIVVQALLKAYQDGNDVINLSLTDRSGWSESVLSVVADRIAQKGKIVTAAAGNTQAYGTWDASAPGTGWSVIDVASVDNPKFTLQTIDVIGTNYPNIPYLKETAFNITGQRPIWVPSDVYACSAITSGVPSGGLANYIVVISRGNCAFTTKIANVQAVGAVNLLVYNNAPGYESVNLSGINGALISQADGQYFQAKNTNLFLTFPQDQPVTVNNVNTASLVSDYSSWGPTNEMYFKPNVAAAGGYILTPWPSALGTWAVNSGTSFSAPLVAGAGALYLQAKGKGPITDLLAGLAFKTQIEQTAKNLTTDLNDSGSITSLALQGAGLMNAYNAVNYKTFITPSLLELNDTANADLKQTILIENLSWSIQTYTVNHVPALTVQTFSGGLPSMAPSMSNAAASVKFSSTKITVLPFVPAALTVTFTPPSGLDPSTFPVYSGQIQISNGKETVSSSYMGLAANMKDMPVIDNTAFYFGVTLPFVLDNAGVVQSSTTTKTYTFVGNDYPLLFYRLASGSASVHVDLVDAKINFTSTLNKRDLIEATDAPLSNEWGVLPRSDSSGQPVVPLKHRRSHHAMKVHHSHRAEDLSERATEEARGFSGFKFLSPMWDWLTPKNKPTSSSGGTFQQVPIIGVLQQLLYQPRSTPDTQGAGGYKSVSLQSRTFANGTAIPNGSYRVLLRALKITGDPSNESDYESWLGPVMNFAAST